MSASFCPNCGNGVKPGAKFCEKCGYSMDPAKTEQPQGGAGQPPVQQQPPQGYQQSPPQQQPYNQPAQPQYAQPQQQYGQPQHQYGEPGQYPPPYQQGGFMGRFAKPPDYIRPPNYVFTETMTERIVGTLKRDVHVVEEIEDRPELQDEAQKLLVISLAIITILNIAAVLTQTDTYLIDSEIGTVFDIILNRFVGGFVYIYLLAKVGQSVGGAETRVDLQEMIRMLSYAYVSLAIYEALALISNSLGNSIFGLLVGIYYIYTLIIFAFVIRRALDKGYGTAILTIIIALILTLIYQIIVGEFISAIFGDTYEIIDPL